MKQVLSLTRKELNSFFSSPMALIFVGVFLAATLFTFFWVDEFFSRGIADLRPMFHWMPILMIFLAAALTMRQWSEEQQTGTLEVLFTMPMKLYQLVLGKFLAALILVVVALALTLFLPLSISSFGNLDPGPIAGGYLATILMASAYIAIGLFVSSRTGNQIVSLILTMLLCGVLQLVGSPTITNLFSSSNAQILRAFGTGSRFASIERGVIDVRDLLYYLSLTLIFLFLNVLSLDAKRWGRGESTRYYRINGRTMVSLAAANLLALNVLLYPINTARLDLTQNHEYSLSSTTKNLLKNLKEPLLIRGYFSEKNHPYLQPLIPQITDMLDEYRIASNGKVKVEVIDPIKHPDKESEANQVYGITPTPVQVTDRYGTSVLNIYFNILIRYGDQNVTLGFNDLISVNQYGNNNVEVRLSNLEYDLTRSIEKVVYGFQNVDAVLASLDKPAQLVLYYTPTTLPDSLKDAPTTIQQVADKIASTSDGKFTYQAINVSDPANKVDTNALNSQYGIQPIAENFLSPTTYYLHMVLTAGNKAQVIFPGNDTSENGIRSEIESALKRAAPGFLKVVGVWTPPDTPQQDMFGQTQPSLQSYNTVVQALQQNYDVQMVDLSKGQAPTGVDILFVVAPENMTDAERYAVDQYLMRGGTLFVAAGNYKFTYDPYGGRLGVQAIQGGLQDMLKSYGVTVEPSLVYDLQNDPLPIQVPRPVGGVTVQEIRALDYPLFISVRQNGMDQHSPILSRLSSLGVSWASPVTVDQSQNANRKVTTLFKSSSRSWTSTDTNVQPDTTLYPNLGFPVGKDQKSYPLAVVIEGSFDSYFKGKPLTFNTTPQSGQSATPTSNSPAQTTGLVESSPKTARLIVVGSSEFLNDTVFQFSSNFTRDLENNTLQFMQNTVDWATEDASLLAIRSHGTTSRLLNPMSGTEHRKWEVLNYVVALVGLIVLGGVWQWRKRAEKPMPLGLPKVEPDTAANG